MRQTPVSQAFFDDELLPLFADTVSAFLDEDMDLVDTGAMVAEVTPGINSVVITVRLPRDQAARIIGKEHSTRIALTHVFSAISKNHGYSGGCKFIIIGLNQDGSVATNSDIFMPRASHGEPEWRQRRRPYGQTRS